MKIWWAELDDTTYDENPGVILKNNEHDDFVVVCGNQKGIRVTDIQPAGSKRMLVKDYLKGSADRIKTGVQLGE